VVEKRPAKRVLNAVLQIDTLDLKRLQQEYEGQ
jgi:hypothetical protein